MASRRPKIRAKVPLQDTPASDHLNLGGQGSGTLDLPCNDLVQPGVALPPEALSQFLDGEGELRADIFHDLQDMPFESIVKSFLDDSQNGHIDDDGGMDKWPQRTTYRKRLKEYQDRNKKTQKDVADYLGLSLTITLAKGKETAA